MRIALIGPSAPLRGGIAQYHDRLAQALADRGHAVRRISFRRQYPGLLFPGRTQLEPEPRDAPPGLPAARALLDSVGPRSWWRVARAARDVDVALCQWWHPFFGPALGTIATLLRRRGVPTIFVCHNLAPHEPVWGGARVARLALGRADAFVAHADADVAALAAHHPGRPAVRILPPAEAPPPCGHGGREGCARRLGLPEAARRVLCFGYVRAYKGLPTLIEAVAGLTGVQLVVAGEIYHRGARYYRALAARHGVRARVVLLDRFLAATEVGCCFAASDVVALPYWTASQSAVAPLAMACGRAVVASAVGGLPDLVRPGETGLLVPPRDPEALARAVAEALARAAPWGEAARRFAATLTWSGAAEAVEGLAERLVGTVSPPPIRC